MTRYTLDVAGLTDRGMKREHNEDAWSAPPRDLTAEQAATKGLLYVVADGVGGHQAGDVASAVAVETIQQRYYDDPSPDVASSLAAAIQAANQAIYHEAATKSEQHGMGTTVTAVVLRDDQLTVANVGDSRTFLIRKGHADQVTTDHTWVEEQVRIGIITREEALKHPQRNIITRSLGSNRELQIDIFERQVRPGDGVLLCSDGLSNMVPASEIGAIVDRGKNAKATAHRLVELAKERGAPDNVTVIALNIKRASSSFVRRLIAGGFIIGLMLLIGWLALRMLSEGNQDEGPISALPIPEPSLSTSPLSPIAPPTATPLPLDRNILQPELVLPEQDASLVVGEPATFSWKWEQTLEAGDWQFVFTLRSGQDAPALIQRELPFNQRGLELTHPLEPGEYWWSVSVVGNNRRGAPAERRLVVIEPTPTPGSPH